MCVLVYVFMCVYERGRECVYICVCALDRGVSWVFASTALAAAWTAIYLTIYTCFLPLSMNHFRYLIDIRASSRPAYASFYW